jgi:hypothetical protein
MRISSLSFGFGFIVQHSSKDRHAEFWMQRDANHICTTLCDVLLVREQTQTWR